MQIDESRPALGAVRRARHFRCAGYRTRSHRGASGDNWASHLFRPRRRSRLKEFVLGTDASMATSTLPPPAAKQIAANCARKRARVAGLRAWMLASRPRRYAVMALAAVIIAGILYGGTLAMFHTQMFLLRRTRPKERPTLTMALDALGHDSYLEARRLAEGLDRAGARSRPTRAARITSWAWWPRTKRANCGDQSGRIIFCSPHAIWRLPATAASIRPRARPEPCCWAKACISPAA